MGNETFPERLQRVTDERDAAVRALKEMGDKFNALEERVNQMEMASDPAEARLQRNIQFNRELTSNGFMMADPNEPDACLTGGAQRTLDRWGVYRSLHDNTTIIDSQEAHDAHVAKYHPEMAANAS